MKSDHIHKHHKAFRFSTAIAVGILVLIGFGFGEEYLRNKEIDASIARMEKENAALEGERLSSLKLIDTLSSSYFVEGQARQSGMGKPGEQLIIVGDQQKKSEPITPITHDDVSNPLRWFDYFFDQHQFASLGDV